MRYLSKYISAALMLILAVACNTKEIDNPDNPDKPQISDNIKIAASIKQTRVSYSVDNDNDELVPDWEAGDVIFGYYGTGDGRIVFTVTGVDETTGIASLEATSESDWGDFLAEYKTAGKDLKVGLIYTGTKETDKDNLFANGNSVSVTMTSQTGEDIPACMHATSFVPDKDDEGQIIRFLFDNDCAIFEIESLTGIAEEAALAGDEESLALTSLTITNLITTYEYSYASGKLLGKSGTGNLPPYEIDLSKSSWTVDKNGVINHPYAKNLLIAVAPNSSKNDILITATVEDGREFSYLYNGNLDAGECYIIKKRDVVAKTADNQYFTSVSEAFDRAAVLSSQGYTTAAENVVTLIKKDITGFGDVSEIEIDYPVTLDLNGCTLNLSGVEYFRVINDPFAPLSGALTITDSTGPDGNGEYAGVIDSESNSPIIHNLSTVIIDGGNLFYTFFQDEGNYYVYSMIENEGGSLTINNDSYLEAGGSIPKDGEKYYLIHNLGELEVNGGYLYSFDDDIITIGNYCNDDESGTVTINGGKVYSENVSAIESVGGEVDITGGVINNESLFKETIQVLGGTECTISGGVIYSEGDISTIGCRSEDSDNPSKLTVTWPNETAPLDPSSDTKHEPVIYAKGAEHYITAPISTESSASKNTAVVKIQGGYLITSNVEHSVVFYTNNEETTTANNLDLSTFGNFYSNATKIHKDGDTWHTKEEEIAANYFELLLGYSLGKGFNSKAVYVDDGFEIPYLGDATGDLYEITTTGTQSL